MSAKRRRRRFVVEVPNPTQVLFPDAGITRSDLVEYYETVGDVMLAHVRARNVAIERYPNGITGRRLFQRAAPAGFPVAAVAGEGAGSAPGPFVIGHVGALAWLGAHATVSLHVALSRVGAPEMPDRLVFDLPPPQARFSVVRTGAIMLARLLADLGLVPFAMTNGEGGMLVSVPLDRRADFAQSRAFADRVAAVLAARAPDVFKTDRRKAGLLCLDTSLNGQGGMQVAPYAVRPRAGAPVATPVDWSEIREPTFNPDSCTLRGMRRRLARVGDPWKRMSRRARSVADAARRLEDVIARDRRLEHLSGGGFLAVAI